MSNHDWAILQTFNWLSEALALKGRLESEGIACRIPEENLATVNPMMTGMQVHLMVPASRLDEARTLIADFENMPVSAEADEGPETCPYCGSTDLREAPGGLRRLLIAVLGFFALIPMRPPGRPKRCLGCGRKVD